jgi:serine/threonine-protein kinase
MPPSAPWAEGDLDLPTQPSPVFATNPPNQAADQLPTIGHIGRYALKYQIGEGGLGTVYAAHDPLLSRLIAIKTVNLEISAEERESFNALFLNEARAAGGLSHPHIVTVFDAGVSEQGAYIAMELLKGRDLRQLRLEGWKPTPTQAALIMRRVSDALAYAHSKGVVHRDIKPANIFMVGRTQPRVLDFGIARIAHQHETHNDGDVAGGSPYYMAPEQVRHETVDRRCDVFSLGVVLYELLTETRPFRGNSLKEITDAVVGFQPPSANEVDERVPKALSDIAARAMQKNPDDRFRSARALSRELRHWLEEHAQDGEGVEDLAQPGKRRQVWMLAGAAALVVASAVIWMAWPSHPEQQELAQAPVSAAPPAIAAPAAVATTQSAASVVAPGDAASAAVAQPDVPAASAPAAIAAAPVPPSPAIVAAAPAPVTAAPAPMATPPVQPAQPTKEAGKTPAAAKTPPKETPKERRAREARERDTRAATAGAGAAVVANGIVRLAISPWGQVEVDGKAAGTAPPLNELSLSAGRHTITIRNDEFPPFSATINVTADQPVNIKHRFGS